MDQKTRIALWVIRALFFASSAGMGLYLAKTLERSANDQYWFIVVAAGLATMVVLAEVFFSRSDIRTVSALVFGLLMGMLMADLFTGVVTLMGDFSVADKGEIDTIRMILTCVFCYLGVTFLLQTGDDFRFIIPYVEFKREAGGTRTLLLDTGALIDGRINEVSGTGIFDGPLEIPAFVIDELQRIADSPDKQRRGRGRRGLDMLTSMRENPTVDVRIGSLLDEQVQGPDVDQKLLSLAQRTDARIITSDYNLSKVAKVRGIAVLNLNDLANALKPQALPGERLQLRVLRKGESPDQGVGYLADGTMVVIEKGASRLEQEVTVVVTGSHQTSAGRMIFGKLE